jgi:hypothetical protein
VRARALRAPVFLGLLLRQTGRCAPPRPSQLRCFLFGPQKYLQSIELGPPTSRASFFPMDHRGYEIWGPSPAPPIAALLILPAIFLGSNYVAMRPCALIFSVFYSFWIFVVILFFFFSPFHFLFILLFLSFSSYPSLLIFLSYSSRRCYSSSSYSSFFWSIFATIRPSYFCFILFY